MSRAETLTQDLALLQYDLSAMVPRYFDPAQMKQYLVAISSQSDTTNEFMDSIPPIAFATSKCLIIMNSTRVNDDGIQTVVEFQQSLGYPSALCWLNSKILSVGFEKGYFIIFNLQGECILEERFHESLVANIKVANNKCNSWNSHVDDSVKDNNGIEIWILYEDGLLVTCPLELLSTGQSKCAMKLKLLEYTSQESTAYDFIILPTPYSQSFGDLIADYVHSSAPVQPTDSAPKNQVSVVVSGFNPALSMYNIGGELYFQYFQQCGKIIEYYKEVITNNLTNSVTSILPQIASIFGVESEKKANKNQNTEKPMTTILEFDDQKRKIFRIIVDPDDRLIASADSLGRVLLFDALTFTSIRIWKGVRDARLAWTQGITGDKTVLALCVYAPQIGLLSIFEMRHGPLLRTIAIGQRCHIFTISCPVFDTLNGNESVTLLSKCCVLTVENSQLSLSKIDPYTQPAATIRHVENRAVGAKVVEKESESLNTIDLDGIQTEAQALVTCHSIISNIHVYACDDMDQLEETLMCLLKLITNIIHLHDILSSIAMTEVNSVDATNIIKFSCNFHRYCFNILLQHAKKVSSHIILFNELKLKLRVLDAYESIIQLHSNSDHKGGVNSYNKDELDQLCRQKTNRSEALCWLMLQLKRVSNMHSGTQVMKQVVPIKYSLSNTSLNDAQVSSPVINSRSTSSDRTKLIGSPLILTPGSEKCLSEPSSPLLSAHKKTQLSSKNRGWSNASEDTNNSSEYRMSPLTIHSDSKACVSNDSESDYTNSTAYGAQSINFSHFYSSYLDLFLSDTAQTVSVLPLWIHLPIRSSIPSALYTGANSEQSVKSLVSFIFSLLLKDIFSFQDTIQVLSCLGLHSADSMLHTLPMLVSLLHSSHGSSIPELFVKSISVNTMQKYIRDTLLAFQEEYSVFITTLDAHSRMVKSVNGLNISKLSAEYLNDIQDELKLKKGEDSEEDCVDDVRLQEIEDNMKLFSLLTAVMLNISPSAATNTLPTYDDIISYILTPLRIMISGSVHSAFMMSVTALILEVLVAVSDQVERRSYGKYSLVVTIQQWQMLFNKLRVVTFLTFRSTHLISVDSIDNCTTSIFQTLAEDTLQFSTYADRANEHEHRCQEVFLSKSKHNAGTDLRLSDSSSTSNSSNTFHGPLLAWGTTADSRWRELLAVAESSMSTKTAAVNVPGEERSKVKRARPLLLYFPSHIDSSILGCYRGIILAQKWYQQPVRIDSFSLVVAHVFALPLYVRATVSLYICHRYLFPLLLNYIRAENGDMTLNNIITNEQMKDLQVMYGNVSLVKEFTRSAIELITYCNHHMVYPDVTGKNGDIIEALDCAWVTDSSCDSLDHTFPSTKDAFLSRLLYSYLTHGGCDACGIKIHISVLWILQLRSQCGLRGVKPCQLYENALSSIIFQDDSLCYNRHQYHELYATASGNPNIYKIRIEFIYECFRLSDSEYPNVVYKLGELFQVPIAIMKLYHVETLLGRGTSDDIVEQMIQSISQYSNENKPILDSIIRTLRIRIGNAIARIDRIPSLGPLIAAIDADAYSWVREVVTSPPDNSTIESIKKGILPVFAINISATKRLLQCIHATVLTCPVGQRDKEWNERNGSIDKLLAICTEICKK